MEPHATSRRAASVADVWDDRVSAKGVGAISHNRVARSCGIAGVAKVEGRHAQAMIPRRKEKPLDRKTPAGLVVADLLGSETLDCTGRLPIDPTGRLVREVVGEVRAYEQEGFVSIPEAFDHAGDVCRRGVTHYERDEAELAQHGLQEGQLHLEAMLCGVRAIEDTNPRQRQGMREHLPIDLDPSKGCLEGFGTARCDSLKGNPMSGSQ
jgi:hypothetical protein